MMSVSEMSRWRMPGSRLSLAGCIGLGACLISLTLTLQTLHGQIVDYDDGVYWQSLRAMAQGHSLFGSVFSSQPPLFLLGIYPFYEIFGQSLVAARLAVLLFSLVGLAGVYVAGRALGHPSIGAVACLLLSLDPLYEASAHAVQAELPSIALQIWAVAFAVLAMRATGRRRTWLVVGAGVALGCALLTKLFAVAALAPVVLYLGVPVALRWSNDPGQRTWMSICKYLRPIAPTLGLLAAGLFGVIGLAFLPYAGELGTVYDQVVRFHLVAAQASHHTLFENPPAIVNVLRGAPLAYIGIPAAIVITWQRVWVSVPLLVWALTAFGVLALLHPLWEQHVVLLSPALAMTSGCAAAAAWQAFSTPRRQRLGLAITLILLMLAGGFGLALNWQHNASANGRLPLSTMKLVSALQRFSAPDEFVLSDDQYVAALADRDLPPQLVDTSFVRIISGYLSAAQLKDLIARDRIRVILFATGRLDQVPGFHAWVSRNYTPVASFDGGGALFMRKPLAPPVGP